MTTEYDARTDSPEPYDPFSEITTFPSGLNLADLVDLVRERPRDNQPFAADQTARTTGQLACS